MAKERIKLQANAIVHIGGIPAQLESDTIVLGRASNLIGLQGVLGPAAPFEGAPLELAQAELELQRTGLAAGAFVPMERAKAPNLNRAVDADPWRHRSAGMRCRTCVFYVEKVRERDGMTDAPLGRCRRHAPTTGGYPVVYPTDWCGDHKLDETKV